MPPDPSAGELTFYCFIARAAPADSCPPATDPATRVTVSLNPTQTLANGGSTTVTATVTDNSDAPEESETVTFDAGGAPGVTISATTNNGDGTYSAAITTNSANPSSVPITATDSSVTPSISGSAQLSLTSTAVGPAANISVAVNPTSIPDDGTTTAKAAATVTDANGQPVVNDANITFSASPAGATVGPTTNNRDGTYSATISSTTVGQLTITGTDSVTGATGSTTLTVNAGPANNVSVSFDRASITANGSDFTNATATVTDAQSKPVPNQTINFTADHSDITIGSGSTCTTDSTGTCSVKITSGTNVEQVKITATDSSATPPVSGSSTLTVAPLIGAAHTITVSLNPASIPADGTHSTIATATVKDSKGNPVDGDAVSFTALSNSNSSVSIGNVVRGATGTGTYMVKITSSSSPGSVTISATDTSVTPNIIGQATLTQTQVGLAVPGAASVAVSVSPVAVFADGVSHAFATAQVDDSTGNPVSGDSVQFFVNGQPLGSPCLTDSSGQCHITLPSSTVVGTETITAVDDTANFLPSGNAVVLSFVPPPPPGTSTTPPPTTTSPPPTTPQPAHRRSSGPSASKIKASLGSVLGAKGASIKTLLKKGSHPIPYRALTAGKLTIDWWDGPSLKKPKLIASVTVTVSKAKALTARLTLTSTGRSALKHSNHLSVKSAASFKPSDKPTVSRSATFTLH